jgi:transcriptional regulator
MSKLEVATRQRKAIARDAADLRILELHDTGMKQTDIAKTVGCSPQHVSDVIREAME